MSRIRRFVWEFNFLPILAAIIAAGLLAIAPQTPLRAAGELGYPTDASALTSASGNVANSAAVATLTATAGHKTYLCGFTMMGTGATATSIVSPTITGLQGGTHTFTYVVPAGATAAGPTISVKYEPCIPASAAGTNIVVTLPALGAGNTNATTTAWGYLQ